MHHNNVTFMKLNAQLILLFIFIGIAHSGWAADSKLQQYPNARIIFETKGEVKDYILALGSYKKINGIWQVDRQVRLSGQQERYTLELPEGHSAENGFDFYFDQLNNYNLRELFYCKARDCGTSNSWANNHFKILQLYGLDQYQHYGAYEITTADEKPFYATIYTVRRGNKRVVAQVDVLYLDKVIELGIASSPESLIKALELNGYYVFPDVMVDDAQGKSQIQIKPAHIGVLIDVLAIKTQWKLALVGHDYAPLPLAEQQTKSLGYAEQLKAALVAQGVAESRLLTYGMASLAPAGRGDRSARVEVVKVIK